jgi:23S rRNA (adenine2503-C2)-methyltransferase
MIDAPVRNPAAGAYALQYSQWVEFVSGELKVPRFRAEQIMRGLYKQLISSWDELMVLPEALRASLSRTAPIGTMRIAEAHASEDGTVKLLLECASDGELVETVLIPSKSRMTQCISSQVGCNFKCAFCASGRLGKKRDLTAAEIVGEVICACRWLTEKAGGEMTRPSNIVVMGMGEPFDNYDEVLAALRVLNDQRGLDVGARHITLSTCGVVPGIKRLAGEGLQFELSVSLHAPNQRLRRELMPVSRRWELDELIRACAAYTRATGRLITFEYTLVRDLNDSPADAQELISLLRALPCKVNLIPLSPVEGFAGARPSERSCLSFLDALKKGRIPVTMRNSRGRDVDAACGQLRLRRMS